MPDERQISVKLPADVHANLIEQKKAGGHSSIHSTIAASLKNTGVSAQPSSTFGSAGSFYAAKGTAGRLFAAEGDEKTVIPTFVSPTGDADTSVMSTMMNKRAFEDNYYMREDAANDDTWRILADVWKSCMMGVWNLTATDPANSADILLDINEYIRTSSLIKVFQGGQMGSDGRGALDDFKIHSKLAIYQVDNKIAGAKYPKFVRMSVDGLRRYVNPRDPTDVYYFQKVNVPSDFGDPDTFGETSSLEDSKNTQTEEIRIWYIPGGDANRGDTNDDGTTKYSGMQDTDIVNDSDKLCYVENPLPSMNQETVTTIMTKRYLQRMSVVAIQYGIAPFAEVTFGNEDFKPPEPPSELIKLSQPDKYAADKAIYDNWTANFAAVLDDLYTSMIQGKSWGHGPALVLKMHPQRMSLTAEFMDKMIGIFNNAIARSVGIPMGLIESSGTELATSRLTKSVNDISLNSDQVGFYDILMYYIRQQFGDDVIDSNGIRLELQSLDKADDLVISEIQNNITDSCLKMFKSGVAPESIKAYIDSSEILGIRDAVMLDVESQIGEPLVDDVGDDDDTPVDTEDDGGVEASIPTVSMDDVIDAIAAHKPDTIEVPVVSGVDENAIAERVASKLNDVNELSDIEKDEIAARTKLMNSLAGDVVDVGATDE
ncbi:MAG: hypothetical protein KAJ03_06615 [Gammaproteobacteria bacterium]|nr:hypothetical protein [Gammaproteobacteria bacterium]